MKNDTHVVIGAGPYGLSVAAHLQAQGIPTLVFGKPMEFWQNMPPAMYLKSVWSASTLFDPSETYSLERYCEATSTPKQEPVPLSLFLKYGQWFQQHAVSDIDQTYVQSLAQDGSNFHLDLADGRSIKAGRVIVATGIAPFCYVPDFARHLPPTLAAHTQEHREFTRFRDRNVVVVGSGQSGLETAALLNESGAHVELIARGPVLWVNRTLYDHTGPARHIFYPPSDVGPPGLNWLIALPLLFRRIPTDMRYTLDRRAVRPAGAQWLRKRVMGHVRLTKHTQILKAQAQGEKTVHLELSDGTTRDVDYLFLGTGFRPEIRKLPFVEQHLQQQVMQSSNGYPVLNEWFESSVPQLHFIGSLANHSFGPICRFVAGSKISARQIAHYAKQPARSA